ncbi:MAG: radical SAM family heme chaperone HemW [Leptospiraceae bacterium]|nr:radical SAM family heme chaperone HemW [Leptospiraceae bacterium]
MRFPKVQQIQPVSSTKSGIYLHFPYCLQKCHYCDFYSVGLDEIGDSDFKSRLKDYESALLRELNSRSHNDAFSKQSYDSIYFGGGTSSLMPPEMLQRILGALSERFKIETQAEITLEGNPENFSADYLLSLHQLGINRVNSGLQTYNSRFLKDMNRYHNTDSYARLLQTLVDCPIPSVGVDLIYGFHGQSYQDFREDLNRVLAYPLQHLSVYSLTVEPETRYARNIRRGWQKAPEEPLQERIFQELPGILADQGIIQYEISNYSRENHICRHNWKYWDYRPYLALGPGAHGFNGSHRYANPRNLKAWSENPAGATVDSERHDPIIDVFLNMFRITLPISLERIREIWSREEALSDDRDVLEQRLLEGLSLLERKGMGTLKDESFQWSPEGLLVLDTNIENLIDMVRNPQSVR